MVITMDRFRTPLHTRGRCCRLRQYQLLSTPGTSLSETPRLMSVNEIAHEECSWPTAMCSNILGDQYFGHSHKTCVCFQIGVGMLCCSHG